MARTLRSSMAIRVKEFEDALEIRYPGVDSILTASSILGNLSSLLKDGFEVAAIKPINSEKARIIILAVEEDVKGGEKK